MGRRKLTALQKSIAAAERAGIDLSDIQMPKLGTDTPDDVTLEAEALLLYFDLNGEGFTHQVCPVCEQVFAYKYKISKGKMRCSMRCRRIELESKGIVWSPGRPLEARWARDLTRGTLPLIIPPEALSALLAVQEASDDEKVVPRSG